MWYTAGVNRPARQHTERGRAMFQALKKMFGGKKEAVEVLSPVSGQVVPLSEVNDPAFARNTGKGCGV